MTMIAVLESVLNTPEIFTMKYKAGIIALLAVALGVTSLSAFAQGNSRGGAQGNRPAQMDRDRQQDRDRMDVPDRDRSRAQDFAQPEDKNIYGSKLMSTSERKQYRNELKTARSVQERQEIQARHHEKMLARANEQGVDLVPPGQGPIFGGNLMSVQERNEYRTKLQLAESDRQRERLMAEHREDIQARSQQRGVAPEETEEAE